METDTQSIKNIIKETINKMGFICEIEEPEENKTTETQVFNIKTKESSFLIGQHGINLQSLQHIMRILVRKKNLSRANFILDINSYRQERNSSLISLAHSMAEQSIREKRAIVLKPMSPYERRIIHVELSKNNQIKTESIGEGLERKVVISPLNLL